MPDLTPLVITAHLANAVAYHPAESITLDGPLLYAVTLERLGERMFDAHPPNDVIAAASARPDPAMPLAVHAAGGLWVYTCSLAEPVGHHGTETRHWHSRFDDALAQRVIEAGGLALDRKATVDTATGEFRANRRPLYVEHVEALRWYAVGDADALARLLTAHVPTLGKKRNVGHGIVAEWEVVPWEGRPDRWLWRDDARTVPARAIPLAMLGGWAGETTIASVRPPYWLHEHQVVCAAWTAPVL
jgi:CRISPR type IV-associated protein Csf3